MKFGGMIKNSFVDYPGEIATVVFTCGCNFDCWYCHNRSLIKQNQKKIEIIEENEVLDFLNKIRKMIDAVVISGGEPTLQKELKSFLIKIKKMNFKTKLDTNGSNPNILKELLDEKLLDYVAMDIKTSFEKYSNLVQKKVKTEDLQQSIKILMDSNIDYEFRTTFSPDVTLDDIRLIVQTIKGAKAYALQKYNQPDSNCPAPHNLVVFDHALEIAKQYIDNSFLRSFD
ncbi:MAG: anaerobic ribonucleoside-triphosphate reductase activating protein [Clostridia bacterium]|nr:anaerobic ribonucleoside-triphosphate reductase activating protein [Clostridia bacterium]